MRVLIVEDEKDLANVLSEMLELEGYHTDIANDGGIRIRLCHDRNL